MPFPLIPILTIVASGFLAYQGMTGTAGSGSGSGSARPEPTEKKGIPEWILYALAGIFLIIMIAIIFRRK